MKLRILICSMLILGSISTNAKEKGRLYMTASDFRNNKLTYAYECHAGSKIKLHDALGSSPRLTVIDDGQKHEYQKDAVYGYRDCNDNRYRFYNNVVYRIEDTGNIYIYTHLENVPAGKGFKTATVYYFSKGANSELLPLTVGDLSTAFAGNDKFYDLLTDLQYRNELNSFDRVHKMYTVNYLYLRSLK